MYAVSSIPKPQDTGIKVIALDQGGIYIGVDYHATIKAFQNLGATNSHKLYTQSDQTGAIDLFERGKITAKDFYSYLRQNLVGLHPKVTNKNLYDAWNAMLTGVIPDILEFIRKLRMAGYITVVVSNADKIHQDGVEAQITEVGANDLFFKKSFDVRYISYQIGFNKPCIDIFSAVTKDLQIKFPHLMIKPKDILFVDDSEKHIVGRNKSEGAKNIGWRGLLVSSNLKVDAFHKTLVTKLMSLIGK